jgi:hypothetical protein
MVSPQSIKDVRAYKKLRNRDNAYRSHSEHKAKTDADRATLYDALKAKIRDEGFDPEQPITIELLRKDHVRDQIKDGHHRFAIALELGLHLIPVRFLFPS